MAAANVKNPETTYGTIMAAGATVASSIRFEKARGGITAWVQQLTFLQQQVEVMQSRRVQQTFRLMVKNQ